MGTAPAESSIQHPTIPRFAVLLDLTPSASSFTWLAGGSSFVKAEDVFDRIHEDRFGVLKAI